MRHFGPVLIALLLTVPQSASGELWAGAATVDVTPTRLPVIVNGGTISRTVDEVKTRLHARALVLDDGTDRIAIVVVDSCMLPRPFVDEVKQIASTRIRTGTDRILISATHTHSAPSCMGALGTPPDTDYIPVLRAKIVEAIGLAAENLEPAQVGYAVADAAEFTALRRWIRRPDRLETDPFGNPTVRATMHAASNWDNVIGESGPEDPDLALISFQTRKGRPLAVLANFSMHYFSGERGLSADYFGLFCDGLQSQLAGDRKAGGPAFVGMMSHGCSGDIWRRDYAVPSKDRPTWDINEYAQRLVDVAVNALADVQYEADADLEMAEQRLRLRYRVPDAQRLQWAQQVVEQMGDRLPQDRREVYAMEQVILHERQETDVVVQALRIGDIGIATTPNETYALTGLKIKLQSPLPNTFVIELANGGDGYIPPPEQHDLGGYNTWAARSAGLEVQAEPKITAAALRLLETVSGGQRRAYRQSRGPAAETIAGLAPAAWWRLDEFAAPVAVDSSGHGRDAIYERGVVFFLDGPRSDQFCLDAESNRAAHFAGGRLRAHLPDLNESWSASLWFWNGMPVRGRDVTGWMLSRGHDFDASGLHLGLGGSAGHTGKLICQTPSGETLAGRTEVPRWSWNHVVLVHDGTSLQVYLNGAARPEIEAAVARAEAVVPYLFLGGRSDNDSNWEGRLDEIAVFHRVVNADERAALAARNKP